MKQVIQNYKTGRLSVEEVPMPVVQPGGVLVQNAFSLISAGTERASVELARKSLLAKAKSRPEDLKKVINLAKKQGILNAYKTAMTRLEKPTPLGYSSAGIVIEIGQDVKDLQVGDQVACAGAGYATHSEVIFVPKNLCAVVPKEVPLDWAAFTTLGAIALQGIRQADIKIGEKIAVIGLGLLGQLTVQILKASGCQVIGIDLDRDKIALAKKSGIDRAILRSKGPEKVISQLTDGNGVDAVIITAATSSNDPFILAPQIARDRAKVVLVGVAKLDFPREPYYRKELSVILSRSYGPGRYDKIYEEQGFDYPIGYVRWTEKRNMEAILQLMAEKKLNIEPLITHKFKIDDAKKAYDLIMGKARERFLGVLFEYDTKKEHKAEIIVKQIQPEFRIPKSEIAIGFIGAGNFAQANLLPNIKAEDAGLMGIADLQPAVAKTTASKYGYRYSTTDYKKILKDKQINTVFIATRHNLHAQLIIESLKAGKHVFCEKPLCLNKKELNQIIKVYNNTIISDSVTKSGSNDLMTDDSMTPKLMLGYNRRFAPLTVEAKKFLGEKTGPYLINYRVNAGKLPPDHWLLNPEQGGGRIIGEVCHFVDLVSYFVGAELRTVFAEPLGGSGAITADNVIATLKYADGSLGTISYFAVGDKDFPKERIEIFGDEKVCMIDDFKQGIFSENGKQKIIKKAQDKGFKSEIKAFFNALRNGTPSPIPFTQIVETTLATFAIQESVNIGKVITLSRIKMRTKH